MSLTDSVFIALPDTLIAVASGKTLSARECDGFLPSAAAGRLMARGRWGPLVRCEGDPLEQWLASMTGVSMGGPPAWAMLGAGNAPALSRWFVSPVHVGIGRDGVSLLPPDALDLPDEHALAFNELLCSVVAGYGWHQVDSAASDRIDRTVATVPAGMGRRAQWGCVLQTDTPLPRSLPSPWALARQRFTDLLPSGAEMAAWRRMWMDVQMALHSHPVNAQRQAQGLPAVNAFWWWGGGAPVEQTNVRSACLRVHDLAQMGAGNGGFSAAAPLLAASPNRCCAWLGSLLVSPEQSVRGSGEVASVQKNSPSDRTSAPIAVHLVENAHAGMWFEAGARHPVVQALDRELIEPLAQAAAPHTLVLTGQSGWRSVASTPALRLKFWQNTPRIDDLLEPVEGLLDEADLARAWQESAQRATPDGGEFAPDRF